MGMVLTFQTPTPACKTILTRHNLQEVADLSDLAKYSSICNESLLIIYYLPNHSLAFHLEL